MEAKRVLERICKDNTHLLDVPEMKDIERLLDKLLNAPPTQEAFNKIGDLRVYLLQDPTNRTVDCLHYLGDDAQLWWLQREESVKKVREMRAAIDQVDEKNTELIAFMEWRLQSQARLLGELNNIASLKNS